MNIDLVSLTREKPLKNYRGIDRYPNPYSGNGFFKRDKELESLWDWYLDSTIDHGIEFNVENLDKLILISNKVNKKSSMTEVIVYGTEKDIPGEFLGYDVTNDIMVYSVIRDGALSHFPSTEDQTHRFRLMLNENGLFSSLEYAQEYSKLVNAMVESGSNDFEKYHYIPIKVCVIK